MHTIAPCDAHHCDAQSAVCAPRNHWIRKPPLGVRVILRLLAVPHANTVRAAEVCFDSPLQPARHLVELSSLRERSTDLVESNEPAGAQARFSMRGCSHAPQRERRASGGAAGRTTLCGGAGLYGIARWARTTHSSAGDSQCLQRNERRMLESTGPWKWRRLR